MVNSIIVEQTIRIVHPSFLRTEVKLRAVWLIVALSRSELGQTKHKCYGLQKRGHHEAQIEIAGTRDCGIDIGWEWIEAFVC